MEGRPAALELDAVSLVRGGRSLLTDISLTVRAGERWVILGANGSGKTSLLRIAALYEHPTTGNVRVFDERLGQVDVRQLRRRIGYASASLAGEFRLELTACDVVMTAKNAALEPWWHQYDASDRQRARNCLSSLGIGAFADRTVGSMSSGEWQRVLLARTLMNDPDVVLLDEPSSRLDLAGREQIIRDLDALAESIALVTVMHHVDEIPSSTTHVLMLRAGRTVAQGPLEAVMTAGHLSECFGLRLHLERRANGRMSAWALADDRHGSTSTGHPHRHEERRLHREAGSTAPQPRSSEAT